MIYIETQRLLLRDWKEEDIEPFAVLNSDTEVMRYFLQPLTAEESVAFYRRMKDEFIQYGYGLYAIEKKDDGAFIGFTGFHNITFEVNFAPGIEIGWRIRQEDWNKGYVTEAAQACLAYAQKRLPFKLVWSFTSLRNKASQRVMQKIGMEKAGEFLHPNVPNGHPLKEHVLYRIAL